MESKRNIKIAPSFQKLIIGILSFGFLVFLALNITVAFYAWNVTHFVSPHHNSPILNSETSAWQQAKSMLFGAEVSKSVNSSVDLDFVEVDTIPGELNLEIWRFDMEPSKGVVALFHGYNSSKSSLWSEALAFYRMGYTVILVDFRASGNSDGNQCTLGFYEAQDVSNTLTWCRNNYPNQKVFLYGMSMGAAAILRSVESLHANPDGILIQSSFPTLQSAVQNFIQLKELPSFTSDYLFTFWLGYLNDFDAFKYNPMNYAKNIDCPTLVIHGMLDQRVTYEDSKTIYKNIHGPAELATFSKSGHESILNKEEANWVYLVTNFMETHNH